MTLTGSGWSPGESVHIYVNDTSDNTWSLNSSPDPVADGTGAVSYSFNLPNWFVSNYTVTATGADSRTASTTFTDTPPVETPPLCNNSQGTIQTDNNISASYTSSGSTATYTLSTPSESSSGGIPGLIEYCVLTATNPALPTTDSDLSTYGWGAELGSNGFGWQRPNGNPSNIPFNGTVFTMGTATWSGSISTPQTIVLHINDTAECHSLYGTAIPTDGTTLTCFVYPGTGGPGPKEALDLTVSKTATPSLTRTYSWNVSKSVIGSPVHDIPDGSTTSFNYTVNAILAIAIRFRSR